MITIGIMGIAVVSTAWLTMGTGTRFASGGWSRLRRCWPFQATQTKPTRCKIEWPMVASADASLSRLFDTHSSGRIESRQHLSGRGRRRPLPQARYPARRCKNAFTKAEAVFKKVVPR
jgi:hypothetical protein